VISVPRKKHGEPTSLRNVMIRITNHNDLKDSEGNLTGGVVDYTREEIEDNLKAWKESAPNTVRYWYNNEHFAGKPDAHNQMVIEFNNPVPFDQIKSRFPYGKIEKPRDLKGSIQYLAHYNSPEKEQFVNGINAIHTNRESLDMFKTKTRQQQEIELHVLIERIGRGEIREWNRSVMIPDQTWADNGPKIKRAMEFYRERILMDKDREIGVVFFGGETGTGKTTFAKHMCKVREWSPCISSSSNDPLQDYAGEDVLVLDDIRDDAFSMADLLKVLDNHTKSTSKSRYFNKAFIGHLIIITSNKPLDEWYRFEKKQDRDALYRRIRDVYEFDPEVIYHLTYNEKSDKDFPYEYGEYITNPKEEYRRKQENSVTNLFKVLGKKTMKTNGKLVPKN
jgi:RNA helicase